MSKSGILYDDLMACVSSASGLVRDQCCVDVNYHIDEFSNQGHTIVDMSHPVGTRDCRGIDVWLGTKRLEDNMSSDGIVRDEDAVWFLFEVFHENAHVWQYACAYPQKDVSLLVKSMAQDCVIGACFPEYRNVCYAFDVTEVFADVYAMRHLRSFLDWKRDRVSAFRDVDLDGIVCAKEFERKGSFFLELASCRTVEDVDRVYSNRLVNLPGMSRFNVVWMGQKSKISKNLNHFLHSSYFDEFSRCTNGFEDSDCLCRYIGEYHPEYLRGFLCIRDEYSCLNVKNVVEQVFRFTDDVKPQPWQDLDGMDIVNKSEDDEPDF